MVLLRDETILSYTHKIGSWYMYLLDLVSLFSNRQKEFLIQECFAVQSQIKSVSRPYYPSKHPCTCVLSNTHQLKNIMNRGINIIGIILQGLSDGDQVLENCMKTVYQREIIQLWNNKKSALCVKHLSGSRIWCHRL